MKIVIVIPLNFDFRARIQICNGGESGITEVSIYPDISFIR